MDEILTDPFVWFAENEERSMPTKSLTPMSMSPLDATCTLKKFEHYIEFSGSFYHYFFFLYGQAQFVCLHVTQNTNECHKSNVKHELEVCQQQNARELNGLITDIYQTATEVAKRGLSKLFVLSFVNKATLFIDKINDLLKTCDVPVPEGLEIDQRVPLPSDIYHFYIWNCS
ncbi:uncharacterized protein B0P05DRAFT_57475 [Gilbertella persicaria]|nr:uncharacterized protein B0P05DRAFT_57475 [Gilbertella persicaria]KAI8082567.1 hypothetical protein B0P05DRAFT_57475 [Gilbertella persicaria]